MEIGPNRAVTLVKTVVFRKTDIDALTILGLHPVPPKHCDIYTVDQYASRHDFSVTDLTDEFGKSRRNSSEEYLQKRVSSERMPEESFKSEQKTCRAEVEKWANQSKSKYGPPIPPKPSTLPRLGHRVRPVENTQLAKPSKRVTLNDGVFTKIETRYAAQKASGLSGSCKPIEKDQVEKATYKSVHDQSNASRIPSSVVSVQDRTAIQSSSPKRSPTNRRFVPQRGNRNTYQQKKTIKSDASLLPGRVTSCDGTPTQRGRRTSESNYLRTSSLGEERDFEFQPSRRNRRDSSLVDELLERQKDCSQKLNKENDEDDDDIDEDDDDDDDDVSLDCEISVSSSSQQLAVDAERKNSVKPVKPRESTSSDDDDDDYEPIEQLGQQNDTLDITRKTKPSEITLYVLSSETSKLDIKSRQTSTNNDKQSLTATNVISEPVRESNEAATRLAAGGLYSSIDVREQENEQENVKENLILSRSRETIRINSDKSQLNETSDIPVSRHTVKEARNEDYETARQNSGREDYKQDKAPYSENLLKQRRKSSHTNDEISLYEDIDKVNLTTLHSDSTNTRSELGDQQASRGATYNHDGCNRPSDASNAEYLDSTRSSTASFSRKVLAVGTILVLDNRCLSDARYICQDTKSDTGRKPEECSKTVLTYNREGSAFFVPLILLQLYGDPTKECWYYPAPLTAMQASIFLSDEKLEGCFLVYKLLSNQGAQGANGASSVQNGYQLSVRNKRGDVLHYRIVLNQRGDLLVEGDRRTFLTLKNLVDFFRRNRSGLATRLRRPLKEARIPITPGFNFNAKYEIDRHRLMMGGLIDASDETTLVCAASYAAIGVPDLPVNVKVFQKTNSTVNDEDDFLNEALILMELKHANIVRLVGICCVSKPLYIITERISMGSLRSVINKLNHEKDAADLLLELIRQILTAMKYLESRKYVLHRNLSLSTVLVTDRWCAKVGYFEHARYVVDDEYLGDRDEKLSMEDAAPEVILERRYSTRSDVWSFGILVLELLTKKDNLSAILASAERFNGVLLDPQRDYTNLESGCLSRAYEVAKKCLKVDPGERPGFAELSMGMRRGSHSPQPIQFVDKNQVRHGTALNKSATQSPVLPHRLLKLPSVGKRAAMKVLKSTHTPFHQKHNTLSVPESSGGKFQSLKKAAKARTTTEGSMSPDNSTSESLSLASSTGSRIRDSFCSFVNSHLGQKQ